MDSLEEKNVTGSCMGETVHCAYFTRTIQFVYVTNDRGRSDSTVASINAEILCV